MNNNYTVVLSVLLISYYYMIQINDEENRYVNIMMILGNNNNNILEDRISKAINYIDDTQEKPLWYFSGGVKYVNNQVQESEANKMANILKKKGYVNGDYYRLDSISKNTAENFAYFRNWMENETELHNKNIKINIITSSFHYKRAKSLFDEIMPKPYINTNWILSPVSCKHCLEQENLHRNNIEKDAYNAKMVYNRIK